jgi:hypothetical protein
MKTDTTNGKKPKVYFKCPAAMCGKEFDTQEGLDKHLGRKVKKQ